LIALSILSLGILTDRAVSMAWARLEFDFGSMPLRAAIVMSFEIRENN